MVIKNLENKIKLVLIICSLFLAGCIIICISSIWTARTMVSDARIETCSAAGLLTTVAELNKQMSVINAHKQELAQLEQDFRNNENEASIPLTSYECGFLRGVSTIAMASSTSRNTQVHTVPTLNKQSVAV